MNEKRILSAIMKGGAVYGDIFSEERNYTRIHLESGRLEKMEKGVDSGCGLRVIEPWKTFYASTNTFDEHNLIELAQNMSRFANGTNHIQFSDPQYRKSSYPFTVEKEPECVDVGVKVEMVRRIDSMARGMEPRIGQVRVVYGDSRQRVRIVTSNGVLVEDERTQVVLNVLVIGEKNGEMQTAYEAIGGFYGFEFFTDEAIERLVEKTVRRVAGLLDAIEAPMGTKTVVLASEGGGTMIHEAVGHGLEADLAMEGLSCYKGLVGTPIASPRISVVDDATIAHMRGTYAYDDEGVPSGRTVLVEKGVLKGYLFDRFHGLKYDLPSTGNGRRESFRYRPIPRMSNTIILPGDDRPDDIVASVDDGILVVKMGGGQVDTVRGDFVFEIAEGYLIKKGRTAEMIKNATMMGNGLKVLQEIDMVGSDLGFGIGTCGKDSQGVPVSDAQPTLRIPEIVVGGRQG